MKEQKAIIVIDELPALNNKIVKELTNIRDEVNISMRNDSKRFAILPWLHPP